MIEHFKNGISLITAQTVVLPEYSEITEDTGYNIVKWGSRNLHPQDSLRVIKTSPTTDALIKKQIRFIEGDGLYFDVDDSFTKNALKILNKKFVKSLATDLSYFLAIASHCNMSAAGFVTKVKHVDITTVRFGVNKNKKKILTSKNWAKPSDKKYTPIPYSIFSVDAKNELAELANESLGAFQKHSGFISYTKPYSPGETLYPNGAFSSCMGWIYTDGKIQSIHSANTDNAFGPNLIVRVKGNMKGYMEDGVTTKKDGFKAHLKSLQGPENVGEALSIFHDGETDIEIIPFQSNNNHDMYTVLHKLIIEAIARALDIPNVLANIMYSGSLGGTKEIVDAIQIYQAVTINNLQGIILEHLNELLPHIEGYNENIHVLKISNLTPISFLAPEVIEELSPNEKRDIGGYAEKEILVSDENKKILDILNSVSPQIAGVILSKMSDAQILSIVGIKKDLSTPVILSNGNL